MTDDSYWHFEITRTADALFLHQFRKSQKGDVKFITIVANQWQMNLKVEGLNVYSSM